jgi:hypothetical protein
MPTSIRKAAGSSSGLTTKAASPFPPSPSWGWRRRRHSRCDGYHPAANRSGSALQTRDGGLPEGSERALLKTFVCHRALSRRSFTPSLPDGRGTGPGLFSRIIPRLWPLRRSGSQALSLFRDRSFPRDVILAKFAILRFPRELLRSGCRATGATCPKQDTLPGPGTDAATPTPIPFLVIWKNTF